MTEHPILFQSDMVRAVLDGRKTVTRRVVKPQPSHNLLVTDGCSIPLAADNSPIRCPYGVPGDTLWVRERFAVLKWRDFLLEWPHSITYRADPGTSPHLLFRPSIHMPRWASRITLEVTAVRVERVQDITEEDARAEGAAPWVETAGFSPVNALYHPGHPYKAGFAALWNTINAKRGYGWDANPWVWVVGFGRITP